VIGDPTRTTSEKGKVILSAMAADVAAFCKAGCRSFLAEADMLVEWAIDNVWVALLLWVALYISDYALTIVGARLRAAQRTQHVSTEGSYELNSYFVQDIDKRRKVSVRFLLALLLSTFLLGMIWFLSQSDRSSRELFEIAFGGLVLLELAVHVRHLRNIFSFRRQMHAGEVAGAIRFSRRYVFWVSALDLVVFGLFYFTLFLFVGKVFFLGGAISCGALAIRHRLRLRREPLLTVP
jgi:hypothetical protein